MKITVGKPKANTAVIITGLACLTILEGIALFNGIDGTLLTIVVAIMAATMGVVVPTPKFMK